MGTVYIQQKEFLVVKYTVPRLTDLLPITIVKTSFREPSWNY